MSRSLNISLVLLKGAMGLGPLERERPETLGATPRSSLDEGVPGLGLALGELFLVGLLGLDPDRFRGLSASPVEGAGQLPVGRENLTFGVDGDGDLVGFWFHVLGANFDLAGVAGRLSGGGFITGRRG